MLCSDFRVDVHGKENSGLLEKVTSQKMRQLQECCPPLLCVHLSILCHHVHYALCSQ